MKRISPSLIHRALFTCSRHCAAAISRPAPSFSTPEAGTHLFLQTGPNKHTFLQSSWSEQPYISSFSFPFYSTVYGKSADTWDGPIPETAPLQVFAIAPGCVTRNNVTRFAACYAVWCEQGCARDAWTAVLALLRTACCDRQVVALLSYCCCSIAASQRMRNCAQHFTGFSNRLRLEAPSPWPYKILRSRCSVRCCSHTPLMFGLCFRLQCVNWESHQTRCALAWLCGNPPTAGCRCFIMAT
jgi:hypothetical protein